MNYTQKLIQTSLLTLLIVFCFPHATHGATIRAQVNGNSTTQKAESVQIFIDTEGKEINVVDGVITIDTDPANIQYINLGGSSLTLWPNKPSLEKNNISFTGGIPNGISGKDILLFTIMLNESPAPTSINLSNVKAFLNDGKATTISLTPLPQTLTWVGKDSDTTSLYNVVMNDKTPPKEFELYVGQENTLFDGKYFVSFNTTDNESGVNRYEVIEGKNGVIRTGSPYVLQDQSLKSRIEIRAIDNAGNVRVEVLDNSKKGFNYLQILLMVTAGIFLIFIFVYLYKRFVTSRR